MTAMEQLQAEFEFPPGTLEGIAHWSEEQQFQFLEGARAAMSAQQRIDEAEARDRTEAQKQAA